MRRTIAGVALVAAAGGMAAAAPGAGAADLRLGERNRASDSTRLACGASLTRRPCLVVGNRGTAPAFHVFSAGTVGGLIGVGRGGPNVKPFITNATGVATGLNADMVDGMSAADIIREARAGLPAPLAPASAPSLDASQFLPAKGKAADADLLDGLDATAFLRTGAKAADADKLDGLEPSAFLPADGKAADADELDGRDSTDFLGVSDKAADANTLDGFDSTAFVSTARLLPVPRLTLTQAEPAGVVAATDGIELSVDCYDSGGVSGIELLLDSDTDDTYASGAAGGGLNAAEVDAAVGDQPFFSVEQGTVGSLASVHVSVSEPGGVTLTGTLTVGFDVQGADCSVAGFLHRL